MEKTEKKPETVDEYLKPLPPDVRAALEKLRKTIRETAPNAEESISWRMPGYRYYGPLVFFAAFKDHCSLFPASRTIGKKFKSELKPWKVSGTAIHFTPENPIPTDLVRKIVKERMRENESAKKK